MSKEYNPYKDFEKILPLHLKWFMWKFHMKLRLKIYYYLLLIKRNHIKWWLEDNVTERIHILIDKLNNKIWGLLGFEGT